MDKILIIQDSPSINALMKFRLESEGFFVDTTETGKKGIEKAKTGQFQIILLDYKLPGIDGVEVCRILKKEGNTKDIPILFMSARDENELKKIVRDAGAEGYVTLPFQKEELIAKIKALINR